MSHTPGPWLRDGATVYAVNEGGSNRMSFNMQGGWLFGYRHSVDDFRTPHEELLANAHLIAAAPDMLEALIWAEAAIAPFSKEPAEKSGMALIRAAIAKASAAGLITGKL